MGPFEFIILFFSFIYSLALTHLLFAVARMIRRRRELVFSWPHALWMLNALLILTANWVSLWDFHKFETVPLGVIFSGLLIVVVQYVYCALVSPDFDAGETPDLTAFHDREGRTYLIALLALFLVALASNAAAGQAEGVRSWASQNAMLLMMLPTIVAPLFVRARWLQLLAPLIMAVLIVIQLCLYYPALTKS